MGKALSSNSASARTRSSHFPRTVSKLPPTRCVGVQRLVPVRVGEGDVAPVSTGLAEPTDPDREGVADRERVATLLREDARSRRRVWYAKVPDVGLGDEVDAVEAVEFDLSMSFQVVKGRYE